MNLTNTRDMSILFLYSTSYYLYRMLRSTPYGVECTEYVTRIIKDKISIAAIHAVQTAKSLHLVAFSFFGLFVCQLVSFPLSLPGRSVEGIKLQMMNRVLVVEVLC